MEKVYSDLIKGLDLLDIYVGTAKYKRHSFPDPDNYPEVQIKFSPGTATYAEVDGQLQIDQPVSFVLNEVAADYKKSKKLFDLNATFTLIYDCDAKMDDALFELFKKRNIPVNIHPYIRELIHDSMTRAGLPSFTLPVLKIKR